MVVGQRALAHQGVGDRDLEVVDERAQLARGVGRDDATAGVDHRAGRGEQRLHDLGRGVVVERRPLHRPGVEPQAVEPRDVDLAREDVHRHVDQHRPRPAALRERERLVEDLGEQVRLVDPPRALDERPVDLELRGVGVQVDLLVRMLAVEVGRHIAGDHHHRHRVECRVRDAGRGVGQAGPEVGQHHRGLPPGARVAIGHVRGDLLVADVDEPDLARGELREHCDVGVAAQAEHALDAAGLEVPHELAGHELLIHHFLLRSGTARRAAPV